MRTASAFTIFLGVCLMATAAPLPGGKPKVRPAPVPAIVGHWSVVWGSSNCFMAFEKNGQYYCRWYESDYLGSWRMEGETVVVEEYLSPPPAGQQPSPWTWKGSPAKGVLDGGGAFQLKPYKP